MYYFIVFHGIIIIKSALNSAFQGEKNTTGRMFQMENKKL